MQLIVLMILILIIVLIFIRSFKIVPQAMVYIVERLGKYHTSLDAGFRILVPFIDRVSKVVSLKEQVIDFQPQAVITKDNVTMQIDSVVYFQITDPKLYTYKVERPMSAIENLTATSLRNIIGEMDLDETLTSRDIINTKMRTILDEATDPWGIKVNRVELKNILPPEDIRNAMEKQMKAERERRESILRAEGEKKSAILIAEGEKEAAILRAEAKKESQIREAQGTAEAILQIQGAKADAIKLLNQAGATKEVLALKGMETFEKVSDGKSTKIIIPSDYQNLASMIATFAELNEKQSEG